MAIDPESLPSTPSSSDERTEMYLNMAKALLAEIDARMRAGTPMQQLQAEIRQSLLVVCAYAAEVVLGQPKELH